jgi:hypothetical protein
MEDWQGPGVERRPSLHNERQEHKCNVKGNNEERYNSGIRFMNLLCSSVEFPRVHSSA